MSIDENHLPEGWDEELYVERDADGTIRRVEAVYDLCTMVLEVEEAGLQFRETRTRRWSPDEVPQALGWLNRNKMLFCSFCSKPHTAVGHLIQGPRAHICDECVALCEALIAEKTAGSS